MYGICNLSVVPCRAEPSDKSEMVTQLLFGEHFKIIEIQPKWVKIKNAFDGYEAWIDKKQFLSIEQHTYELLNSTEAYYSTELIQIISDTKTNTLFPIVIGSNLPNLDNNEITIENNVFLFEGNFIKSFQKFAKDNLLETAMLFLNSPYLWGGRSPMGIDCSGFTQLVYKMNGVKILRDAYQQAEQGETLSFVEEAEPGDLAFFDNEEGRIVHVGIVMDDNKIIHASGKVRIDGFDHHGIFNNDLKTYTHQLRLLKKII